MSLTGMRIVVIGGTSGIGRAIAESARAVEAIVYAVSRSAGDLRADLNDGESLRTVFAEVGPFDHLVVSVSTSNPAPLLSSEESDLRQAFESKFWGALRAIRLGMRQISKQGSIILVSGVGGRRPFAGMTNLLPLNSAVEALVKALAVDLAPVRVNGIAPGLVDTPYWDRYPSEQRDEIFQQTAERVPVRRIGCPQDCARAAMYLLAAEFVTGHITDVDGGALLL